MWRIARLMRLGRKCPDLQATVMFDPDECQAVYILNKKNHQTIKPKLNEVVHLVARLGGFLARTGNGEPGVKTLWLGMQRILDFARVSGSHERLRCRGLVYNEMRLSGRGVALEQGLEAGGVHGAASQVTLEGVAAEFT